ncbi:MAG: HAMP domain-containing protein, partial [Caldilineaceae bacterium]|nr:HAMP domain-containing protein [Caldilineaceae bacterium]
ESTQSLLQAEQDRLTALATLLSERPTLARLLRDGDEAEMGPYLEAFRRQSGLDILILCSVEGRPLAGTPLFEVCPQPMPAQFAQVEGRSISFVSRWVVAEPSGEAMGRTVVGNWLDADFLRQLASDTGVEQSILSADGTRMESTIAGAITTAQFERIDTLMDEPARSLRYMDGRPYYVTRFPISSADAERIWIEVALPAGRLIATERRALLILAASTGMVALIGLVLGILYVRRLTTPLRHMTGAAERISSGDLTASVPAVSGPLEVTTLATALQKSQQRMVAALDELAHAHAWLDSLVQSVAEGVVTFDHQGRITFLNQKAAALTALSAEEAVGKQMNDLFVVAEEGSAQFLDLLPPHGGTARVSIIPQANRGQRTPRFASRPGLRSPRRISAPITISRKTVLEITAAQLTDPGGDAPQMALVLRDITEEETLRHLRAYFLANITHEFRTPLSTLNASIELLTDEREDLSAAEMRNLLKPVHVSLLGLQTLIDNLLESSSIEAGRFVLRRRPRDLNEIIADALKLVRPLLERRRQSISLSAPAYLTPVNGDQARLTQVLVNLLTNASKYSPLGAPIDLVIEQGHDRVRIAIADRGAGIPSSERANIFRNFVRVDASSESPSGTGLGLYVVKTTVEAHGGEVGIEDRAEGGSIFWFQLPISGESPHENLSG